MTAVHSSPTLKPSKPYPEFPLYAHASGRWAKKIRGRTVFFGPWADPDAALDKYFAEKDALHAGRKPREQASAGVTVRDLLNRFLNAKANLRDNGEITPRTWSDYKGTSDRLIKTLGKTRLCPTWRRTISPCSESGSPSGSASSPWATRFRGFAASSSSHTTKE